MMFENLKKIPQKIWYFLFFLFTTLLIWSVLTLNSDASKTIILYGNVDVRDVNLSFLVPGRISAVQEEEGSKVYKNQLLASLEKTDYIHQLCAAQASVDQAIASLKIAQINYESNLQLYEKDIISKNIYETYVAQKDMAVANLEAAFSKLEIAKKALQDTDIFSPSDGTIVTRIQEVGAIVNSSQPVYILALDESMWVRSYISEVDLGRVYIGQKVEIYTDTDPKKAYIGQIGSISAQAEFTPKSVETTELRSSLVYRIRINLESSDPKLKQGMPVTIKINLPS